MTNPHRLVRSLRRALALPAVLLLVFVGLGIALAIHRFSTETYRRTSRGVYGTISELLAESAVEEAWYTLQKDVNTPNTDLYKRFRDEDGFENLAVLLPVLHGKLADGQFKGYLTERYEASGIKAFVSMVWGNPYGNALPGLGNAGVFDTQAPWERYGTVTIVGQASARARIEGLANFRKLVVRRPFRTVKVTPPVPFDRTGLVILYPEHMTDVVTASTSFDLDTVRGGKATISPLLNRANTLVSEAQSAAKEFNDKYKGAASPPFGDHITKPPEWLDKIIREMDGIVTNATKLDLNGSGRRPYLFNDEVLVARNTLPGGKLGKLADFDYTKKIAKELKPLNDLADALNKVQGVNNKLLAILEPIHRLVPYGTKLDLMCAPLMVPLPEVVPSVRDVCEDLHKKIMDPILDVSLGVGQVLSLAQKIVIEVPMMGQQAFAGFTQQIASSAGGGQIATTVDQAMNLKNDGLMGLPTNTPAMGFTLNMPLPNYTTADEVKAAPPDAAQIAKDAGEAVVGALVALAEQQLVAFIRDQIAQLTFKIGAALTATAAACTGGAIVTFGLSCAATKAGLAIAFQAFKRLVFDNLTAPLNKIGRVKGNVMDGLVRVITRQIPFFRDNVILRELQLESLLGDLIEAAYNKQDISPRIEGFVQDLAKNMAQKMTSQITDGLGTESFGGILKGYALRHRFRNLIEFDGVSSMNAFGQGAVPGAGPDGLNMWRSAFDRVYDPPLWEKKATWIVRNPDEFEALRSRYCDGKFLGRPKDPSGDGTSAWKDSSFRPNAVTPDARYGLSGIIYYPGAQPLELDFPDSAGKSFKGKCILYVPNAPVTVKHMRMRDPNKDAFTLICKKPITLPAEQVDISVHAVGSGTDCKVQMTGATINGNLILKSYALRDQNDPKSQLDGELIYNEKLNGTGGDAMSGMKRSHLFVTISPFVISREMKMSETEP